ncbi:hypothetical protein BGZ73_008560 [Actinomortierella ambigua]|nr:hypothetical protein BGZ73_008560 [Actinomortierella ambigua]
MRFAGSIFLLAAASAAFAYDAVISKGLFIGTDSTEPGASLEQIFSRPRNHVTATCSLLQYYGHDNNYIPRNLTPVKGFTGYEAFKSAVKESPAFAEDGLLVASIEVKGDLDELQYAIREAIPYKEGQSVAVNLVSSIPTKSRSLSGTQVVLFSLVEIVKPRSQEKVTVRLVELPLVLETDAQGHVQLSRHMSQLNVIAFVVNPAWLEEHAELLAEYVKTATTYKKFVQLFTTIDDAEDDDENNDTLTQWIFGRRRLYRDLPHAC